ncbi:hypothetical protein RJ640_007634 [Escallonia rubra]|uniref:Uncharacterized protein n=1 Tax=Escallonia rubra TaxID=112253 RepID=A0AA88RKX0_9ASTE|nr:hypothetical protein RJ640_007634 [Escallonia rubra]
MSFASTHPPPHPNSALTYDLPISRKRPRDQSAINPFVSFPCTAHQNPNHHNRTGPFTFLGEDISLQIQQQQLEIDRFIAQHLSIQSLLHIFRYLFHRIVDVLLKSFDFSGVQTDKVQEENHRLHGSNEVAAALMDDAESCCGSNYNGGGGDN